MKGGDVQMTPKEFGELRDKERIDYMDRCLMPNTADIITTFDSGWATCQEHCMEIPQVQEHIKGLRSESVARMFDDEEERQ